MRIACTCALSHHSAAAATLLPLLLLLLVHCQGVGKRKTYAGSWVESLNNAGYSVAGIDNRGCGRSAGLFGYVNDHTDWVNDLVRAALGAAV